MQGRLLSRVTAAVGLALLPWGVAFGDGLRVAPPRQKMLALPVEVVDSDGKPVEGAIVRPWALRCSQGHGMWRPDGLGGSEPADLATDAAGVALLHYPRFAKLDEQVQTTQVTLSVDHPKFVYVGSEDIDVPRGDQAGPHKVTLERGAIVELLPMENGEPAGLDELFALWSDGRFWRKSASVERTERGGLELPAMKAGPGEVMLVRLNGERATAFSPRLKLDLKPGQEVTQEIALDAAVNVRGKLSDEVPRPVKNGRVKISSIPTLGDDDAITWGTWAPVEEDGAFVVEGWPAGEALQVTALCDGFIGAQGEPKFGAQGHLGTSYFRRPQLFAAPAERDATPMAVDMEPLAICEVQVVDQQGKPVANATVIAGPNVHWWNDGSQIYCRDLVRWERILRNRDYFQSIEEEDFGTPFQATTDVEGRCRLELPDGKGKLFVKSETHELPVVIGRREFTTTLTLGLPNQVRLELQPKGTELLGDWDKLAGVLFGCTGEQCRRLISDPGFRRKMDDVRNEYDKAEDKRDPALLSKVYTTIEEAFAMMHDQEEAAKWRRKAKDQAAKQRKQ